MTAAAMASFCVLEIAAAALADTYVRALILSPLQQMICAIASTTLAGCLPAAVSADTVSIMRNRFAFSELPVSVTSTIASASMGGFTSVAPRRIPPARRHAFLQRYFRVTFTQFRRNDAAAQFFGALNADAWAGRTQRTLPRLCLA